MEWSVRRGKPYELARLVGGVRPVFAALRKFESARFGAVRCEKRASNGYPPGKAPFRICPSCANALVVPNEFDTNLKSSAFSADHVMVAWISLARALLS